MKNVSMRHWGILAVLSDVLNIFQQENTSLPVKYFMTYILNLNVRSIINNNIDDWR